MSLTIPKCLHTTLKIQPAVILFSSVSILAKLASGLLPKSETATSLPEYVLAVISNVKFMSLVILMFAILGVYAVIWQILIKNARIAVIYANKSSYLLWTQLAAVLFFGEYLSWSNIVGICIIFAGIMLSNGVAYERA